MREFHHSDSVMLVIRSGKAMLMCVRCDVASEQRILS